MVRKPIRGAGWVFHLRDLLEQGYTKAQVYRQVRLGTIIRLRIGWFARPDVPSAIARAVRVGGRLACVSAAEHHGLDVPVDTPLHIAVPANAPRLRARYLGARHLMDDVGPVIVHWCASVRMRLLHQPENLIESIVSAASCVTDDWFVAMVDSGIACRDRRDPIISPSLFRRLLEVLDEHHRALLDYCDPRAESCIESLTRFRLRLLGIMTQSQVIVAGVRVDFVMDRNIVIEVDGSKFHSGVPEFEADRVRDAVLNALGYRVLRFSYRQVVDDWPSVLATILEVRDQERTVIARRA